MMKRFLISVALVLVVGTAFAQTPVNCEGLKNSLIPYEIRRKSTLLGVEKIEAVQVFRDRSGAAIVWARDLSMRDLRITTRSIQYNGFAVETEVVRFIRASGRPTDLARIKTNQRYDGINPKTYDYQRDAKFNSTVIQDTGNGPTEKVFTLEFKFVRNEPITLGSCFFSSSIVEVKSYPYGAETSEKRATISRYIPELMIQLPEAPGQLVVWEIATSFETLSFEVQ